MTNRIDSKTSNSAHQASWWNRTPLNIANQPPAFWRELMQPDYYDTGDQTNLPQFPIALSSGLASLDAAIAPILPGDLVCIASRPEMGATALALQFCTATASASDEVLFVSLDLTGPQVLLRFMCAKNDIDLWRLRRGEPNDEERKVLDSISGETLSSLVIDEERPTHWGALPLASRIKTILDKLSNCSLIVVDGLQYSFVDRAWYLRKGGRPLKKLKRDYQQKKADINDVLHDLRLLARARQCAIIITFPLGRAAEKRQDHRPRVKDLAAFARAAYWCDTTLLLYRPEVYFHESALRGRTEISIYRRRRYTGNTVVVGFDGRFTNFKEFGSIADYVTEIV